MHAYAFFFIESKVHNNDKISILPISLKKGWYWSNVYFFCCNFSVVILEHSEDGPDWRDFVFATSTYIVDSKRFETSLHKFSLSKDIVHVTQAAAASQEGWKKTKKNED